MFITFTGVGVRVEVRIGDKNTIIYSLNLCGLKG